MDLETQKIIQEQMKVIPEDIALAIISVEYSAKMQEVVKRQKLLIDQAGKLEMETTLVMIGLEPLKDYVENISRELGISMIRAKEIAMDVSENIFKPIRNSLQRMNEKMEGEETASADTNVPSAKTEPVPNRDEILNDIENPQPNRPAPAVNQTGTAVEVRPASEIMAVPKQIPANIVEAKMTGTSVISQETATAQSGNKLPEASKKTIYPGGSDPYREPLI